MLRESHMTEVAAVLRDLSQGNGGMLDPDIVVAHARDESSPLHEHFEWDETAAAHEHRRTQARKLIRSVRMQVTINDYTISVPAYVHDPDRSPATAGYTEVARVMNDAERSRELLASEVARISLQVHRARSLARVCGLTDEVETLMNVTLALQERLDETPRVAAGSDQR